MSVDKSAESFEGSDSSSPTSYDSIVSEANAGREELYDAQNKMTQEIKLGLRRSGITDEFGKPIFFDTKDTQIGIPAGKMESAVPLDASIGIPTGEMGSAARVDSYTRPFAASTKHPEQPVPAVDQNAMAKVAEGIYTACAGLGTDENAIYKLLEGRSKEEIAAINALYQEQYGMTLEEQFSSEMSGAYKEKALSLLDGTYSDVERVHAALLERSDWNVMGRTNAACEKDIRDTISTMNSEQIAQMDEEYRAKHGVGIREALLDDPNLSDATKQALEIYLKGTDQRTEEDIQGLAEISIYAPPDMSVDMLQEAFRDASREARQAFMESPAGQTLDLLAASGITIYESMRDYARDGHLSTATKIYSTDTWLGDNEVAIEQTLSSLSADERQAYLRGKELAATDADEIGLSEEDRQALENYREIRGALEAVGNTTELARWEDMIARPGGSLVSRLAEHAGTICDSGMQDVLSDIENMSQEDWERLRNDPAYCGEIEGVLKTYLSEAELARATSILDKKAAAESYEEALQLGRRSVLDAIADNAGYFSNDERAIVEAVSHMTPDEQRRYREDPEFKHQVDEALASALQPGPELDAAQHLLEKVERGEELKMDIVSELNVRAGEVDETGQFIARGLYGAILPGVFRATEQELRGNAQALDMLTGTRAAGVVDELEKAFKEDPALRDRLTNPQTDEDRRLAVEFDVAIRRSVSDLDYEAYIKPLLETGQLPIDKRMELHQSLTDVDEQAVYEDMLSATPEERERLLNDPEYQQEVLGFLGSHERQVALNVLEQGEIRPEDIIYSQTLGLGTGEEEIKAALKDLSPEELERVRSEYARKYGSDLTSDLLNELGGQDQVEAVRDARRAPQSNREAFNQARDEFYESRDGLGKQLVDFTWDGTGYMANDALNRYAGTMSQFSARFEELPPEKQQELIEHMRTSLDLFRESKGSAADAVVDTAIASVAVGGAFFTDGVSLGLLAATGLGAGMFKVGAKAAIEGSDYDFMSQAGTDFAAGFVDGALSFVGPGEIATVFKVGDNAALAAGEKVFARGGAELIAGGEEALDAALTKAVRDSIVNGSYKIDDAGLDRLVAQVAKEGATDAEKAELKQLIKESLSESLDAESRSALERIGTEYALNMGAGGLGGGASGTMRGMAEWDTSASFEENMMRLATLAGTGAGFGAGGAAGFTTIFKGGGVVYRGIHGVDAPEPPAGTAGEAGKTVDVRTGKPSSASDGVRPSIDTPAAAPLESAAPATDAVPGTVSDEVLWNPERDLIKLSEAQKAEFNALARGSDLYKAEAVDAFADSALQSMKEWDDAAHLLRSYDSSLAAMEKAQSQLRSRLPEGVGIYPVERAREALAGDSEGLKKLEELAAATDSFKRSSEELKQTLAKRQEDLQQMLDEYADAQGLPHVKVAVQQDKFMGSAAARYQDGIVQLRTSDVLGARNPADLVGSMYHEFAHSEQDFLMIRAMADELGIGVEPTFREVNQLIRMYEQEVGSSLSGSDLQQRLMHALEKRDGEHLSPDQLERAHQLVDSFKNNAPVGDAYKEAADSFRIAQRDLALLNEDGGSYELIQQIAADKKHAEHLFGSVIPAEVQELIDLYERRQAGENIAWPDEAATQVLEHQLQERMASINADRRARYDRYMAGRHEREAFVLGERARLMADEILQEQEDDLTEFIAY